MESSRGAEPATLAPPASLASKVRAETQNTTHSPWRAIAFANAGSEVTREHGAEIVPDSECDEGARLEIDAVFRHKLAGLRWLPKRDRLHARRVALDERAAALRGLRHKREIERQFRRALLLRSRAPKPPG